MTTQTIYLSSNSASTLVVSPTAYMYDTTTLVLNTQFVSADKPLLSITVNWGDGTDSEYYTNDFFSDQLNVINEISFGYDYTVIKPYSHEYSPSSVALTRILSAQLLVNYFDNTSCRFLVPVNITNPSLINKAGDLNVLSVNALSLSGNYIISLHTANEGFVIDTVLSV
jgi:hypothetical protein